MDNPTSTQLQINETNTAKKIDTAIAELISPLNKNIGAIERGFKKAEIYKMIKDSIINSEKMKILMEMQGTQVGFRTDVKPGKPAYSEAIVLDCFLEAITRGVEPTGNQFNILGGTCYITKNGCKHILNRMGIKRKVTTARSKKLPNNEGTVVPCTIEWNDPITNELKKTHIDIGVSVYEFTKEETMKGAAERDALAWLIEELTGQPMPVGESSEQEIVDAVATEVHETTDQNFADEKQQGTFDRHISKATNIAELEKRAKQVGDQIGKGLEFYNLNVYNELKEKFQ